MNHFRKLARLIFHLVIYLSVGSLLFMGLLRVGLLLFGRSKTHLSGEAPDAPVALVLGAGLNHDGTPGVVLQDRVRKASELYFFPL